MLSALALVLLSQTYGTACSGTNKAFQYDGTGFVCATITPGAPIDATYITQTANSTLTAEQAMGSLGTGLVLNTTTTGVQSIYAGTSCTNQFPRSLNASGAATCSSVADADITALATSKLTGTVTNAQLASSYSGVGACGANTFASTLNANAAPTCTQPSFANLSGTATATQMGVKRIITSNVTNSTTTPATTGLSWSVAANTEYGFTCVLNTSGTATSLARFNLNGPASPTTVAFTTQRYTTTAAQTLLVLQAFSAAAQTAACTAACNATVLPTLVAGTILNGANAGTADLQVTSSTAGQAVVVYRGSYCQVF